MESSTDPAGNKKSSLYKFNIDKRWDKFNPKQYLISHVIINLFGVALGMGTSVMFGFYSLINGVGIGLLGAFFVIKAQQFIMKRVNVSSGVVDRNNAILDFLNEYTGDVELSIRVAHSAVAIGELDVYNKTFEESIKTIRRWYQTSDTLGNLSDCSNGHTTICKHRNPKTYRWLTETS